MKQTSQRLIYPYVKEVLGAVYIDISTSDNSLTFNINQRTLKEFKYQFEKTARQAAIGILCEVLFFNFL
jgi:hypothetical protein